MLSRTGNRQGWGPTVEALEGRALLSGTHHGAARQLVTRTLTTVYTVVIDPVNHSGVRGTGDLSTSSRSPTSGSDNKLNLTLLGLEPNHPHDLTVNGFSLNSNTSTPSSVSPPALATGHDLSADGSATALLSDREAQTYYGPPASTFPSLKAMRSTGWHSYHIHVKSAQSFMGSPYQSIIIHGMTVNGHYDPTVPVAVLRTPQHS